jgi:GT2 family glycosyltransferase
MQPTVSVVLPTYNRAKTIAKSIESVLNQTFQNFELLIINDGSTDDTDQVLAGFESHPQIRIIRSHHVGCAAARNLGVRASRGQWIAFQDSDDLWLPQKLSVAIESLHAARPEVGVFYSDMLRIDSDGTSTYHHSPLIHSGRTIDPQTKDFQVWRIGIQSTVIKRECFDKVGFFDETLPRYIDLDLFIRLAQVYPFQHCPQALVEYHYAADGITKNRHAKIIGRMRLLEKYKDLLNGYPAYVAHQYLLIALAYKESGNLPQSYLHLLRAFLAHPAAKRLWSYYKSGGQLTHPRAQTSGCAASKVAAPIDLQNIKVRVVIPFYRGHAYIERCVQSLADSSCPIEEIIIVDNSPERFVLPAVKGRPERVKLTTLTTKPKIGFGNACNIGIEHAISKGSDVVLLLNQDAHLETDCLKKLCKVLLDDDRAFATFPIALNYECNSVNDLTLKHYVAGNKEYLRDLVLGTVQESYKIGFQGTNGSCVALRPNTLQNVGYFDPVFWMYGEDRDLLYRASLQGYHLWMVPGARIGHLHSNNSATGTQRRVIDSLCRRGLQIHELKNPRLSVPRSIYRVICFSIETSWHAFRRKRLRLLGLQLRYDLELLLMLPRVLSHRSKFKLNRDAQQAMRLSLAE